MKTKQKYRKSPWKRNFRQIPDRIIQKLSQISGDVTVAVVRKIPVSDIENGRYAHLNLRIEGGKGACDNFVLPNPKQGKYSERNQYGFEIVHKNRPKVKRPYSFQVPNWGDWHYGSHLVTWNRDVYQREFRSPKLLRIKTEIIGEDVVMAKTRLVVKFALDEVLSPSDVNFNEQLFFNLNLLQENIGACDVYSTNATKNDYLKTIYLNWEILPPGERNNQIERILGVKRQLFFPLNDNYFSLFAHR